MPMRFRALLVAILVEVSNNRIAYGPLHTLLAVSCAAYLGYLVKRKGEPTWVSGLLASVIPWGDFLMEILGLRSPTGEYSITVAILGTAAMSLVAFGIGCLGAFLATKFPQPSLQSASDANANGKSADL